ncbi:MAG: restriction endonuclease [Solirubrobacteraceae bacterium]
MAIDKKTVARLLTDAANAPNTDAQGKAYETLAAYLFSNIPGCTAERNIFNLFETEQVDVAVGNERREDGLPLLPAVLLVECKDWAQAVDSKTVGYFMNILAGRSVEVGILIAANGTTGGADMKNANALGLAAAPRGIKVLVITTADILSLSSTADLVKLLNSRYLRAVASGTLGLP